MCKKVQDHCKLPQTAKRSTPIMDFGRAGVAHPSLRDTLKQSLLSSPKGSEDCVTPRGSPLEIWEWIWCRSCPGLWSGAKSCPRQVLVTIRAWQLFSHSDQVLLKALQPGSLTDSHKEVSSYGSFKALPLNCPAEDHLRLVGKRYNMHESSSSV